MSFVISNKISGDLRLPERKLERLDKKALKIAPREGTESSKSSSKTSVRMVDHLRYEVSSLGRKSVELQKRISRDQFSLDALDKFEKGLAKLSANPGKDSISDLRSIVEKAQFEGKKVLESNPNKSSDPTVDAVTVTDPPKVGHYSVSILKSDEGSDSITYTIDLEDTKKYDRSLTTKINRLDGLIEGVEIYFEEIQQKTEAQLEIIAAAEGEASGADFSKSIAYMEKSLGDQQKLARAIDQTAAKIEGTREGIRNHLAQQLAAFQGVNSAQENIQASSPDAISLDTAKQAIVSTNNMLSNAGGITQNLFTGPGLGPNSDLLD